MSKTLRVSALVFLLVLLSTTIMPVRAQLLPGAVTLTVDAGFAGYFRENRWLPIVIRAENNSDDLTGRLVVRPETSGQGLVNTYSTPITLASGGRQTAFLYVTARGFTTSLRVELINDEGLVIAAQPAPLRAIQPRDRLYIVVTEAAVGATDMTGARVGSFNAFQADWTVERLPDNAAALDSVDMMLFNDVDTGALSDSQRRALSDWVTMGGHLVVAGGPNWQSTAAGLGDLLPLTPESSRTIDDLNPLADWLGANAGDDAGALADATVIATGTPREGAQTLVADGAGTPLLTRRVQGAGVVDYLSADPGSQPLRDWGRLSDLWLMLAATTGAQPSWSSSFNDWEQAARAVEILPGYNPLPDILPLCGFLVAYIALIGPINYIVLSRLNRREWAWVTIPILIVIFSALAWAFGLNLRGNEATLNRLAVVQTWPTSERAQVDMLIGLLSPRRTPYDLALPGGETLRPIPRPTQGNSLLTLGVQSSVDIRQSAGFGAVDFTVDASFVAGFNASAMIERPAIGGLVSFAYDSAVEGQQTVRGSVSNNSDIALQNPVILARGTTLRLDAPLEPGDVATFDLTLPGEGVPAPAFHTPSGFVGFSLRSQFTTNALKQSVSDILGTDSYVGTPRTFGTEIPTELQEQRRRQFLLSALIEDTYSSTGRGDRVFLAGWGERAPLPVELDGAPWNSQELTLYLIELENDSPPPTGRVTIAGERFTWLTRGIQSLSEITPVDLSMQPDEEVVFQFTPLPDAVLSTVEALRVQFLDINTGGASIPIELWDWSREQWEEITVRQGEYSVDAPERFLGPQNAVQLRVLSNNVGRFLRVGRVVVEQVGRF